MYEDTKDVKR